MILKIFNSKGKFKNNLIIEIVLYISIIIIVAQPQKSFEQVLTDDTLKKSENQIYFPVIINYSYPENHKFSQLPNADKPLDIPTYDGSGQCVHPSVIDFVSEYNTPVWCSYRYWMSMSPLPNTNAKKENPSIIASHDGIHWEVPKGLVNPLTKPLNDSTDGNLADPELVYNPDSNELWLYYMHRNVNNNRYTTYNLIKLRTDMSYSKPQEIINLGYSDSLVFVSPCIWRESSDKWHMWAVRMLKPNQIIYLGSKNGLTWSAQRLCFDETGKDPFTMINYRPWHICCKPNYWEKRVEFLINCSMISEGSASYITRWLLYAQAGMKNLTTLSVPVKVPVLSTPQKMTGWDYPIVYRSSFSISNKDTVYYYNVWYSASSMETKEWHIGHTEGVLPTPFHDISLIAGESKDMVVFIGSKFRYIRVFNQTSPADSVILKIFDDRDHFILTVPIKETVNDINISNIKPGIYIAEIAHKRGIIIRKIVRE